MNLHLFRDFPDEVSVVIPTLNSARHIDIILEFYREQNVPVTVLVDRRSHDNTFRVAREHCPNVRWIRNPGTVVEDLMRSVIHASGARWILRVDDDELPSSSLLDFVGQAILNPDLPAFGFLRFQCALSPAGSLLWDRQVSPFVHQQWRLFQPSQVTPCPTLHTSGFLCAMSDSEATAPPEASMVHLDWAVRTYKERRMKVARYDAHTANAGSKWRAFYLHEEQDPACREFEELDYPEFRTAAREIAARFSNLCLEAGQYQYAALA